MEVTLRKFLSGAGFLFVSALTPALRSYGGTESGGSVSGSLIPSVQYLNAVPEPLYISMPCRSAK